MNPFYYDELWNNLEEQAKKAKGQRPKAKGRKWSNRLGSADFLALDGLPLLHKVGLVGEVDVAAVLVAQRGVLKAEKWVMQANTQNLLRSYDVFLCENTLIKSI